MEDSDMDLEDIESRLYSQIHHASTENEQNPHAGNEADPSYSNPFIINKVTKHTDRYFHNENVNLPSMQSTYISFDDLTSLRSNIYSQNPADVTTETNFRHQFQNNITVNQYTLPFIINSEVNDGLNPTFDGKFFTSWAVKNQKILNKKPKRNSKRLENRREKQRKSKLIQGMGNHIIYVSDDSDDECVIQDISRTSSHKSQNVITAFPKKYNENDKNNRKPESDDDIIYIPPPPIEVVNVDSDEREQETVAESLQKREDSLNSTNESQNNEKCIQKEITPEPSSSNDFLDNVAIENNTHKFNFSLHGSDFNNSQGDFVRPANPVDFCETESSCSTNDPNRDFKNSVNTIVFDEVEFPRDDIFSENNLEKFGTYITPRRNTNKTPDDTATAYYENTEENTKTKKLDILSSCSSSSSESDYESSKCRNPKTDGLDSSKKLPILSPLVLDEVQAKVTTPKRSLKRKSAEFVKNPSSKDQVSIKNYPSKRKFDINISESDSGASVEAIESKKQQRKKISKSSEGTSGKNDTNETPSENNSKAIPIVLGTQKKTKKKQAVQTDEESTENLEKQQSKGKTSFMAVHNSETEENVGQGSTPSPQKKRKKKTIKSDLYEIENSILADVLAQKIGEGNLGFKDSEKPEDRNKKGASEINSFKIQDNTGPNEFTPQKKKKKISLDPKSFESGPSTATSVSVQQTENVRCDSPGKSRIRKKRCSLESMSYENEENNDADVSQTIRRNRYSADVIIPESTVARFESEMTIKKRKDRALETTEITEPESSNDGDIEKRKKKSISSEDSEINDTTGDKEERTSKRMSFSESSDQQPNHRTGDKIEAEVQKKKKKKSSLLPNMPTLENASTESICNSIAGFLELEIDSSEASKIKTGEPLDDLAVNLVNQVETSPTEETEQTHSDEEELIVVDAPDLHASDFIVVDEMESTMKNVEDNLEIVLSSDSEFDFKELNDVGKDLELANCSLKKFDTSNTSEEIIVVDDNSGSNFTSRLTTAHKDYGNFNVESVQNAQSDNPDIWKISHKDRMMHLNMDRDRGPRCNRCRQFGHVAIRCEAGPPNCSLCGSAGHQEPRCPNKICTQCGSAGDYSTTTCRKCWKLAKLTCRLCNMNGHVADKCPDLWRRYHLTTEGGPIVVSKEPQLKSRIRMWCSGCANQGHLEYECNYFNREYAPTAPYIVSYADVSHQRCSNRLLQETAPPQLSSTMTTEESSSLTQSIVTGNYQNPVPSSSHISSIPSLMSLNIPAPSTSALNDNRVETKVLNPCFVLANRGVNSLQEKFVGSQRSSTKKWCKNEERINKHIIMSMPYKEVRTFLRKSMAELDTLAAQGDPKFLKKKLWKYALNKGPLTEKFVKDKCFWYRVLNMFIFGVHKFRDGNLHMNYLRKYLSDSKQNELDENKRKSLCSAYNYIFGVDSHVNVNYFKIIKQLIRRYDNANVK